MGSKAPRQLVIVGNGMVSHGLCEALTAAGTARAHAITVIGDEPYPAYDRVHLSAHTRPEPELLASQAWYAERGIRLRLGQPVVRIEPGRQVVHLADADRVPYDTLVLATGAAPRMPGCEGLSLPGVFVYRSFDDVTRIRAAAVAASRAVVVGGGLLGLEAARLLQDAGLGVDVLEASRQLMPRQLDADSAIWLRERVEAMGVRLHLAAQLEGIAPRDGALEVRVAEAEPLLADVVVIAIGVEPRDELARGAGLLVGARGGVIVDDALRSSDPHIFAIGDCACHRGRCYGLIAPGLQMAETLARQLQGKRARFRTPDLSCELKLMGVPVSAVGDYDREARVVTSTVGDGRRNLLLDSGRLVGATAVGNWPELPRVRAFAERQKALSPRRLARFMQTGELFPDADPSATSWPESVIVCNCKRVTKGELMQLVPRSQGKLETLYTISGAGTVCGTCRPRVAELMGAVATVPAGQRTGWLLGISAAAALCCALLFGLPALPVPASVQSPWQPLDALLLRTDFKQLTGFVLAGLAACSLVLSLRKRTKRLSWLSFGSARALHAALGSLSLLVLLAHTGLRLGSRLNFALLCCFVGAAVVGSAAGTAASLEGASRGLVARPARRSRNPLTWLHIVWLWPLPVLLGTHVFVAYYF